MIKIKYDFIRKITPKKAKNFLLLQATSSQIDTCCLYTFVSHEVGKQGYIVELLQEILGITMAERVRVHHFFIQAILHRIVLQLL